MPNKEQHISEFKRVLSGFYFEVMDDITKSKIISTISDNPVLCPVGTEKTFVHFDYNKNETVVEIIGDDFSSLAIMSPASHLLDQDHVKIRFWN